MPRITVLLPTRQSERYLQECVESVLAQDYKDYELLVVDDASTDRTIDILQGFRDPRIRIMEGDGTGLAGALNKGLCHATGEYVARIDADDRMSRDRLTRQLAHMERNTKTAICGSWQQYFGRSTFCHKPSATAEQCRANLLFRCDLCHSTLLLRKAIFLENNLFYDGSFAAEDYELWTRVLDYGEIENIPAVLGYYRDDGQSITERKKGLLIRQHGEIVAAALWRSLGIELTERQKRYFPGWVSPFHDLRSGIPPEEYAAAQEDLKRLLKEILTRNRELGSYDEASLRRTVAAEWASLRYREPYRVHAKTLDESELFRQHSRAEVFAHRALHFCSKYRGPYRKYLALRGVLAGKRDQQKGDMEQ